MHRMLVFICITPCTRKADVGVIIQTLVGVISHTGNI